ncbi:MAG: hypothetical protein ACFWTJ_01955 [Lachnoclostridium sp.]
MKQYVVKEDIYDDKGILLLRKGEIVNKSIAEKLRRYRISSHPIFESKSVDSYITSRINKNKAKFIEKFKIKDEKMIDYTSKIVENIIFESKDKSWWLHVKALISYVDWLYTHSLDTALISLLIGIQLNYTDTQLWNLGLGALLHDVGKMLIPKEVLNQPDPSNDVEMAMMRQHCILGTKSMKEYNLTDGCLDIILHHHERLDGSGYPDRLKGKEISLNCRIVMIADTIDMITSARKDNVPNSMDEAVSILKNDKEKYPQELLELISDLSYDGP